jgi:hypothetical protein
MARSATSACSLTLCASRLATIATRANTPNRTICSRSSDRSTGCIGLENSRLISATLLTAARRPGHRPQRIAEISTGMR